MKRILKLLARMYPAEWRARYGAEYDALLEEKAPRARDVGDVLWSAMKMQIASPVFAKVAMPCALVGLAVALAVSFRTPQFTSMAVLWAVSDLSSGACGPQQDLPPALRGPSRQACDDPIAGTGSILRAWTQSATDRPFLASLIQTMNLYHGERKAMSLDQLVDRMRRDISVLPRKPGLISQQFELRFSYPDPQVAQQVVAKVLSHGFDPRRIQIWAPQVPRSSPRHQISVGLDSAPSLGKLVGRSRAERGLLGLFGGLLCGLGLTVARNGLAVRRAG